MRRVVLVTVVVAGLLLAGACGEEAERGHDEPSPHGAAPPGVTHVHAGF